MPEIKNPFFYFGAAISALQVLILNSEILYHSYPPFNIEGEIIMSV